MVSFNEPFNRFFQFVNFYQESYGLPDDIFERYHIGRQLGSGAQGTVRLIVDRKTCEKFAMKHVNNNGFAASSNKIEPITDARIMREVCIMTTLSHPNIIRCKDVIIKPNSVYMVGTPYLRVVFHQTK